MNKQENKLLMTIYDLDFFPKFTLYQRFNGPNIDMPMNHGPFARGFAMSMLYLPWTSLEKMIERDMRWSYWGRSEYEHWEQETKIVEDGYYEQFERWWNVPENKASLLNNPILVDLYTKVTNKRKKLKSYKEPNPYY